MKNQHFEVMIIGGSYSGLAAAMSLGRSLRNVLVIDSGKPCNRFTPHSQNFLTQDGKAPAEIAAIAKQQVAKYNTVQFLDDLVISGTRSGNRFEVVTQAGKILSVDKLIFATGIKDILPNVDGFAECWGKSVIHCPYCHGYEFRGKKTAIWVNETNAWHLAPLVRNLSTELTLLTNGNVQFNEEERAKLSKNDVTVIDSKISAINHKDGQLQSVSFDNGDQIDLDALYAGLSFEQHCPIPVDLGCELNEQGYIKTDMFFKTTVDGVYACGDNVSPFRSVSNAVANGNFAGAAINRELAMARFDN